SLDRTAGPKIDHPVVAPEGASGVFEVELVDPVEAELPADRVGWAVRHTGERVDEIPPPLGASPLKDRAHGFGPQSPALEFGEPHPPDLTDRLAVLLVLPDADRTGPDRWIVLWDDHEVPDPAPPDVMDDPAELVLQPGFRQRPSELRHHPGIGRL